MQPLAVDNALVSCQQPHSGPPQMASINEKAAMTGLAVQPAVRSSEHGLPRRAGQAHHLQWLWGCQDRLSSAMVGILSVGGGAADRAAWLLLRGPRTLPVWSGALGSVLHDISTKYTLFGPMSEIADFRCSCA